jgi:hypothetical protein
MYTCTVASNEATKFRSIPGESAMPANRSLAVFVVGIVLSVGAATGPTIAESSPDASTEPLWHFDTGG